MLKASDCSTREKKQTQSAQQVVEASYVDYEDETEDERKGER
jgi:hypothetical protein